jgi:hypothetical protein
MEPSGRERIALERSHAIAAIVLVSRRAGQLGGVARTKTERCVTMIDQ